MRATTIPLDAEVALHDVAGDDGYLFVRDGVGFAGQGVAARVDVDDAVSTLAEIEHDDRTGLGRGPIALSALPFRPGADAQAIIPRHLVAASTAGGLTLTSIDEEPTADILETLISPAPIADAAGYQIAALVAVDDYLTAVATARDAVRAGTLDKAVIARPIEITSDRQMSIHAVLGRLRHSFRSTYRYSIDGLVGASPELLVAVEGSGVSAHPLAGTTRTTGDPDTDRRLADELQASEKNQIEHRVAIEMVRDTLLPYCSYLDWAPEPSIVKVANVQHLGSAAQGQLSRPGPTVIELVRALQPTPAVGGYPRDRALELIDDVEGFERGRYGGAVGWVDAAGNGAFAVTLRCAEFNADRRSARLVAGGGIVADSDPRAELSETQAKLQAMLGAIVRP